MALKPDRIEDYTNVRYFCYQVTERGGMAWHDRTTTGSPSMDDGDNRVLTSGTASGSKPAGLMLQDVVNIDLTRQHLNQHKVDEVQLGGKVCLLVQGEVKTDRVATGDTILPGDAAYYNNTGVFTKVDTGSPVVGQFTTRKDADGYATVYVDVR